jgi:hypothetical protein
MSTRTHGNASSGRFSFEQYHHRKLELLRSLQNKKEISEKSPLFENGIKFIFKRKNIKGIMICERLKQILNESDFNKIKSISPYQSSSVWIVIFSEKPTFIIDREILIQDELVRALDASITQEIQSDSLKVNLTAFFRVHWLSPFFDEFKVGDFAENFLKGKDVEFEIVEVKRECYKESTIQNGVVTVKIVYDIKFHDEILDLVDLHEIDGQQALFQLTGMPPKCLFCKCFGHTRAGCAEYSKFCSKCKMHGHIEGTSKCTTATYISGKVNGANEETTDLDNVENVDSNELIFENGSDEKAADEEADEESVYALMYILLILERELSED